MTPSDDAPAPEPAPEAPAAPPPARATFVTTTAIFDRPAGHLVALTEAQAAEHANALRAASEADLAIYGRPPIVI